VRGAVKAAKSQTSFLDDRVMSTRDNLKAVIEALRERHGLLAAYLEAAGSIDWRALQQSVSIDKLVAIANSERSQEAT
jgi:hypothetical protein